MTPDGGNWARVREVFEGALARSGPDRAAYLTAACGSDRELREEVDHMLASHAEGAGFLSVPAAVGDAGRSLEGQRIGPYQLGVRIGAGGMGEVYRARDTRLDRTVAVKLLPLDVAHDRSARERFVREARVIATLNHPNICALYDVGDTTLSSADAPLFLVMELLEGETLGARLARGALPPGQALAIGAQIASALAAAHRAGIVHRDLKPGNVFLVRGGGSAAPTVKLLDFGLAKAATPGAADSATRYRIAGDLTTPGTIVGTVQYMAPEQVEGREIDARTDIFALGAVLHEMLTGAKAFAGKSQASLSVAILEHDPPPVSSMVPSASPSLDRLVARCLAKDPEERWQSAADLGSELMWIARSGEASTPLSAVARTRALIARAAAAAAILALIAATAVLGFRRSPPPAAATPKFFSVPLPYTNVESLAIVPDGSGFVTGGRDRRVYLHSLADGTARPLEGTEAAQSIFFSPDGRWLGFQQGDRLKRIAVAGGSPVTICSSPLIMGASWGPDDQILLGTLNGLWRVSAAGGTPTPLTKLDDEDAGHLFPAVLPGGMSAVFTAVKKSGATEDATVEVVSLQSGRRTRLVKGASAARYVPTGHLLYAQNSGLAAVSFDPARLAISSPPVQVVSNVNVEGQYLTSQYDVAQDGTLLYLPGGGAQSERTLVWLDRHGTVTPLAFPPRTYDHLALLPDGHGLIAEVEESPHNIWRLDFDTGAQTLLTHDGGNHRAVVSPDGRMMAFSSDRQVPRSLFRQPTDGSATAETLLQAQHPQNVTSWSGDGRWIAYTESHPETKEDIWVQPTEGDRRPIPFLRTRFSEYSAVFSSDGRWIAYASDESGRREVFVTAFPGPGPRRQVSAGGGALPLFSKDGGHLYYRLRERIYVVDITTEPSLTTTAPRVAFEIAGAPVNSGLPFPVTASGDRVLYPKEPAGGGTVHLVANWFDELRRITAVR